MVVEPIWVFDDAIRLPAAIPSWHLDALCREYEQLAQWWFPEVGHQSELRAAQEICQRCLVQRECLADALDTVADSDFGCWGGTTKEERRVLRKKGVTGDLVRKYGSSIGAGRELELDLAALGTGCGEEYERELALLFAELDNDD